jgi:hypothetical protein
MFRNGRREGAKKAKGREETGLEIGKRTGGGEVGNGGGMLRKGWPQVG